MPPRRAQLLSALTVSEYMSGPFLELRQRQWAGGEQEALEEDEGIVRFFFAARQPRS